MAAILSSLVAIATASWNVLVESAFFVLFGLLAGGLLQLSISTETVARHLGRGRFSSVFKAALFGIPLPLCSCGVLPAAAALKARGASNGATMAFLIATPETGIDSIGITYALLDPVMTVARPVAAFLTACAAGIAGNLLVPERRIPPPLAMASPRRYDSSAGTREGAEAVGISSRMTRAVAATTDAINELWSDLAGWFFLGILIAGVVEVLVPDDLLTAGLGGGIGSMLLMAAVGIPLYICATASTPIAAALITKGVSPGTALVFLLAGPATNATSIAVLAGLIGRRGTMIYLAAIAVVSVLCGLALDGIYAGLGLTAAARIGQAAEVMPAWVEYGSAGLLVLLSVKPLAALLRGLGSKKGVI